ncbi:hypothetical protein [Maritalea sp. S77]|uniref:hypothetical protein n=1 Tax=Maritalea sp. S77 TaxID=3415125 RepID=UPI003C7C3D67
MDLNRAKSVEGFEKGLRRLGWLSAYSRQILMTRHLLRNLSEISYPDEIPRAISGEFALNLFRCAITILAGVNRETQQFSSPYDPPNRPETHHLAFTRKERIFSTSIASGMPEIHFHVGPDDGFGLENSTEVSFEDGLFSFEIHAVAKNVGLTTKALADRRAEALRNEKLWRGVSSRNQTYALKFFENWYEWAGKNGAFWREWYQGFLDGKPLEWELQRRVALIDDVIWKAGPEAVAEEIEKVRAKYYLEKHIDALEVELRKVPINRHGIGGNMPPEPLDDVPIAQELIIVLRPLEDLKNEISKELPDPTQLQNIIEALTAALNTGLAWCLKKVDLMVDTTIKWAIPAGGTGYFALNPEKLEAVIAAAKNLLGVL